MGSKIKKKYKKNDLFEKIIILMLLTIVITIIFTRELWEEKLDQENIVIGIGIFLVIVSSSLIPLFSFSGVSKIFKIFTVLIIGALVITLEYYLYYNYFLNLEYVFLLLIGLVNYFYVLLAIKYID